MSAVFSDCGEMAILRQQIAVGPFSWCPPSRLTYPTRGIKASRSRNPCLCRLSWKRSCGVLVVAPRGLQAGLAAHPSSTFHVGGHALGLLDEVGQTTAAYLWKNSAVLFEILLRDANRRGVRAATCGITHACRERRLLPRRRRGQRPQTGLSGLRRGQYCHLEKATDQRDPTSSPAHDFSCLVAETPIRTHPRQRSRRRFRYHSLPGTQHEWIRPRF